MGTEITNYNPKGQGGIIDLYTPIIGSEWVPSSTVPRWLPRESWRRIKAYEVLERLYTSSDPASDTQLSMNSVRLGTVAYIVQLLRDLTVGGEQRITVAGAEDDGGDATLKDQQNSLADWASRNKVFPKLQEAERHAGLLGDAVYRLRIGRTRGVKDVKLDVIHPSFVFPEYNQDDEITSVALVWEETKEVDGITKIVLYKDIYSIGTDGFVYETAGWYNYSTVPSFTDLRLDEFDVTVDGKEINNLNTGLTAIPILILQNFWTAHNFGESDLSHVTDIAREMNATDTDLSAAATLLGVPPMVVAGMKARINAGKLQDDSQATVGPGQIINVDTNGGRAEYMDNSNLLTCLLSYYVRLEKTLFRNTRLGKLFSGETDNLRDIESSKALKTLLASLYARIAQKRTVRHAFYADLLRTVRDLFVAIGQKENFPEEKMAMEFGNILPSDNSDDLKAVSDLWAQGKGPVSAETAVRLAQKAGSGVVDISREAAAVTAQVTPPKPTFGTPTSSTPVKKPVS